MTSGGAIGGEPGYRLTATGREEAEDERLGLLEQLFDPGSRRRRDLVRPGWRCLEVGAGRGSMATWLAERVGPGGQVVATDIDCRYLARLDLPNLQVVQHNILDDPLDALGPGSFDLVCTRLVLFWLAGRQQTAIHQMVACLRPGGWLIDEEGDWGVPGPVDPSHPLYAGYHHAFNGGSWWATRGYDPFSAASYLPCSSAAACRASTIKRPPGWYAEQAHGRDGGSRTWTSSAAGGWPAAPPKPPTTSTRRSPPPAATRRSGSSPNSCTPAGASDPVNSSGIRVLCLRVSRPEP